MVPSPCGPKAPSALSLSATLVAIALCLSLRKFSNLFHCRCFRPMGISYDCPSPVTDRDKSSGGATQKKNPRGAKSGSPRHLSTPRVLHTPCFAASQSPAEGLVCSLWGGCFTLLMSQEQLPSPPALIPHWCLQFPAAPFARLHQGVNLCLAQLGRGPFPKFQQVDPKSFKLCFIGFIEYGLGAVPRCPDDLSGIGS